MTNTQVFLPGDLEYGKIRKEGTQTRNLESSWTLIKRNCRIIGHGLKSDFTGINIKAFLKVKLLIQHDLLNGGRLLSLKYLATKCLDTHPKTTIKGFIWRCCCLCFIWEIREEMKEKTKNGINSRNYSRSQKFIRLNKKI